MLIKEITGDVFDTETIKRGQLISAKHRSWSSEIPGIIARVLPDRLWIQYLPTFHNVKNCYAITAADLTAGEWSVRYSIDGMATVQTYPEEKKDPDGHLKLGSIVTFVGGNQCYTFWDDDAIGTRVAGSGAVKIVEYIKGKAHPYYVITRNWSVTKANGWVDEESLRQEE